MSLNSTVVGEHVYSDGTRTFSVARMIAGTERVPVTLIRVSDFLWELGEAAWDREDGEPISPWTVLADPVTSPAHAKRIFAADLRQPVLLVPARDLRRDYLIADGLHRLARAAAERTTWLRAVCVPPAVLAHARLS